MAKMLGVSFTKVYKWNWERKKKDHFKQSDFTLQELSALYPRVSTFPGEANLHEVEAADDTVSEDGGHACQSMAP